jgi:CO/xanthine dehydrogenase Mo-binding subunit
VSIGRDGTAHVRSAATALGTGTYTIATQVAAELLGLDIDQVHVEIGDSDADVPDLDVVFVGAPDTVRPLGIKGLGEISGVGLSAAIANAVYHATGRRIRSLPITVEQLL